MNADVLKGFFEGRVRAAELARQAARAEVLLNEGAHDALTTDIEAEFTVTAAHLVALCDAVTRGDLKACQLEVLAAVLVRSEKFTWDPRSREGGLVSRVIYAWEAPEINYVLSPGTMPKFRHLLLTGEDRFENADWSEKPGPR